MSEEQLKAFIARIQADTSLQEQLKVEGADVVEIAKAAGFLFTNEDLAVLQAAHDDELSTEELEEVAGGTFMAGKAFLMRIKWTNTVTPPRPGRELR